MREDSHLKSRFLAVFLQGFFTQNFHVYPFSPLLNRQIPGKSASWWLFLCLPGTWGFVRHMAPMACTFTRTIFPGEGVHGSSGSSGSGSCRPFPCFGRRDYSLRYLKTGATPEETMYLSKYAQTIDGQVSGCTDGNWILRQADPKKDFIQLEAAGPMKAWISRRVVCRFVQLKR